MLFFLYMYMLITEPFWNIKKDIMQKLAKELGKSKKKNIILIVVNCLKF